MPLQMIRLSWPIWRFYFLFHWFFCLNLNTINKSMILHNNHVNFFVSTLLALLYLFTLIPTYFLISFNLCESLSNLLTMFSKQMKVLQINQTSPVFFLFFYSFLVIASENLQTISISMYINIFSYLVRNDAAKI